MRWSRDAKPRAFYCKNGGRRKAGIWWWVYLRGDLMWFKDSAATFIELGKCLVVEEAE
jgi:hypothetical protein